MPVVLRGLLCIGITLAGLLGGGVLGRFLGLFITGGDTGLHGGGFIVLLVTLAGASLGLVAGLIAGVVFAVKMAEKDRGDDF